jgi:ActR/RegA family two-component response regulator
LFRAATLSKFLSAIRKKGGESRMTIVKIIAIVAVAATSLSLGACASKPKPAPVSASYSK